MKRFIRAVLSAYLLLLLAAPAAHASVNVNRNGDENPMQEVAKSTIYGGLAGLVMGSALAWASDKNNNDADLVRWGFVGGTFVGFGMGLWWVSHRPAARAALEFEDGGLRAQLPVPEVDAHGKPRLALARVRF